MGWVVVVTRIALLLGVLAPGGASAWDRGRGGFRHGFHGPRVFFGPRVFVGPRFCQDPAGYYPTVAACPSGWIQVSPRTE